MISSTNERCKIKYIRKLKYLRIDIKQDGICDTEIRRHVIILTIGKQVKFVKNQSINAQLLCPTMCQ